MSYNYRDQLAAFTDGELEGPSAGDRISDALIEPRLRLFDLARHARLTLLLVPRDADDAQIAETVRGDGRKAFGLK